MLRQHPSGSFEVRMSCASDNGVSFSWQVTASGEQEVLLTVPLWGSDTDVWGRTHSNEDAADAEQHVCNSIDMLVKGLTLKKGTP